MSDRDRTRPTPEELAARVEGRAALSNKQRGQLPKVFWKEQEPSERVGTNLRRRHT